MEFPNWPLEGCGRLLWTHRRQWVLPCDLTQLIATGYNQRLHTVKVVYEQANCCFNNMGAVDSSF
jgi:hypothetical protein